MKDVNGKEIRPGAKVRRTEIHEGIVTRAGDAFIDETGAHRFLDFMSTTVEVLEESRIEEPTTLGTVVLGQCPTYPHDGCRIVLADPNAKARWWCATHRRWTWWGDIKEPHLAGVR